jgi:2-dehydropantoate 2-reductase
MRLGIIGCGALGSLFAALLCAHTDLVMLGHWPAQMAGLRHSGLTLINPDGRRSTHHFQVTSDAGQVTPVEAALVLVKSYQTAAAALEIKQMLLPGGMAITLQNGLGNAETLSGVLGEDRVAQGITALGATMEEAGLVRFAGHGPTHLARPDRAPERIEELASLLRAAGLETHLAPDLNSLAWGKLVINSAINPLTALLRVPNGFLAEDEQARGLMIEAARETADVARALSITLPYSDAAQRVLEVARATAANQSSMLQDVRRGSPTEIEAINGAVVRYGRQANIPTPINQEFLRLVRSLPAHQPIASELEILQALLNIL